LLCPRYLLRRPFKDGDGMSANGNGEFSMRNAGWFFVLATGLAGCVSPPPLDLPQKGITAHQIINRVKCEILAAVPDHPQLMTEKWQAVGALTVQVDDEGSLAATTTFINPAQSFAFSVGGGVTADRERIYSENFSIDIEQLERKQHRKKTNCDVHYGNPLLGDLGITETIDIGLHSLKRGGPVDFNSEGTLTKDTGAFGETIQFVLEASFTGLGPTWTLVRFTGPTGSLGGAFRKDTNRLIISFAPSAPPSGHKLNAALSLGGFSGRVSAGQAAAANNLLMLLQSTRGGRF
jgi:hypothetical protein